MLHRPERLNAFATYAADYAYTHSRVVRKLVIQQGGRVAANAATGAEVRPTHKWRFGSITLFTSVNDKPPAQASARS